MLNLSREKDQTIMIGDDIEVMVCDIRRDRVGIGIRAPRSLPIHRKEIWEKIQEEGIDLKNPYEVDSTHTDPTQQETALCLKYRQRARAAEELNKVLYEALVNECIGCGAAEQEECNTCQTSKALSMAEGESK